jgi:hypothetical protein
MQRTTAVTVGLLFALGLVLVLVMGRGSRAPAEKQLLASASASVTPSAAAAATSAALPSIPQPEGDAGTNEEAFDTLPDGRSVPELPDSAPKTVSFGVVLVTYQGAQSAPTETRSKTDAQKKAAGLVEEAKRDFAAAVAKGDRGSSSNVGRIPRGILEPAVEYQLFSLEKGSVHPEPIDTPRGYWLVRRND